MQRTNVLACAATLLTATLVWANAAPPPAPIPKGHKRAEVVVHIQGTDACPNHAFYFYYQVYFGEQGLVEVKDAGPIKVDMTWKLGEDRYPHLFFQIFALPRTDLAKHRAELEKVKKTDDRYFYLSKLVRDKNALTVVPSRPSSIVPESVKPPVVTATYRVAIKVGVLSADKVESKKSAHAPTTLLPGWALGLGIALSLAWLGLTLARRRF